MKDNLNIAIIGIGLGLFGAAVWYAEMFTDSKAANLWRRMNGKGRISRNYAAIGAPAFACIFLLGGILGLINYFQLPGILSRIAAISILAFLSFFLIGLLPIKFPRWVYADWQYAKRHGLLDDDGNIDREAWARHHANKRDLW